MVFSPGTVRWLADYNPLTTDGYTSGTASASVQVSDRPAISFTKSTSYSIPYVRVEDWSDYSVHRAEWRHWFNYDSSPSGAPTDTTWVSKPWLVVKTTQDQWSFVDAKYHAAWIHLEWQCFIWCRLVWVEVGFTGDVKFVDAQRSGDT